MAHVLIVDDERVTRETLRDLVRWRDLGVDEIETARDGADALERIVRRAPDVILCDIRMPRCDGLKLAGAVRERHPECGIIFLSGFAEKENLKAAIRLQAADFIEKPINLREVTAAVGRLLSARRTRAAEAAEVERTRRALSDFDPVRREAFALALVGGSGGEALRAHYQGPLCDAFLAGSIRGALVMLPPYSGEGDVLRPPLAQETSRALNRLPGPIAAWPATGERVGVVVGREPSRSTAQLAELLDSIHAALERHFDGAPFWIGVGPAVAPDRLEDSVRGAEEALGGRFYHPDTRWFHAGACRGEAFQISPGLLAAIREASLHLDVEAAVAVVRRAEAEAQAAGDRDLGRARAAFHELLDAALEAAPGFAPGELRLERDAAARELVRAPGLRELAAGIEIVLHRRLASARECALDRRIERVKACVHAQYADPDLTVEAIAAAAGLSESYLCTLFKSVCGLTVKEFVTRVRVERAQELLRRSDDKLHAVALEVGFRDANYFSTVFKREVGITPSEYRERALR